MLDTLGKKAGPEDTRTPDQRHHDALEDACRRLIAARALEQSLQFSDRHVDITQNAAKRSLGDIAPARTGTVVPVRQDGA